jgi:(1->4)-alpha-D-glucan 1-alpha-D-glucosylmutase
MLEALHRACLRAGIATYYHDVWGRRVEVAPARLAALLAEFGFGSHAPDDAPAWEAELAAREAAQWRRALPPVQLVQAGETLRVPLRLAADASHADWSLTDEQGAVRRGSLALDGLEERERRDVDGQWIAERVATIAEGLPMGYHRLRVEGRPEESLIIAAPARCYVPGQDDGSASEPRHWGIAVQLYGLRSARQWGIGDFGDFAALAAPAARLGAQAIGLNPLHALFPHDPGKHSPYSPSSRLHLNLLYIDVEAAPGYRRSRAAQQRVGSPEFQTRLAALREAALVDHAGVAAAKLEVLSLVHADFAAATPAPGDPAHAEHKDYQAFVESRGEALQRHALFDALQTHFHARDPQAWGWPMWPEGFQSPDTPQVRAFAAEHAARVDFFAWLQWVADGQLQAAAARCRTEGLSIGLYLDQAVSVDRYGSDAWGARDVLATGASVGAPPDEFNPLGQDWGLPPLKPVALRETGYALFIDTLRAGMRGAGALRIDHVMGLTRLFCMPPGATPADGAYVHYPAEEMLAIVALESQRHRCMVIGEDLGTVSDETRHLLQRFGLLSYRLLYFEREGAAFKPPQAYPREALAAVSTHDLATLQGWWSSTDLQERIRLGLFPRDAIALQQLADRAAERAQLMLALQQAGLLDAEAVARALGSGVLDADACAAVHRYLAQTPARLMMVQAEDLLGEREQANMPGTLDTHPNWRRRLPLPAERWPDDTRVNAVAAAVVRERPAPMGAAGAPVQTRIPRATYRLQFHEEFTFDDAIAVLPYLARLGISHVYCSPIQRARPGSRHGYDVVAHDEINPELGGFEGFARFTRALQDHGMGQLLDLVPNHMGVLGADNPWWLDVLENGEDSAFARYFDIEWQPLDADLAGKVLLPVLGDSYGAILDRGELVLALDETRGALSIRYHEHRFPLAPASYAEVLRWAEGLVDDAQVQAAFASIGHAFAHLPRGDAGREVRAREQAMAHARLVELLDGQAAAAPALRAALEAWNRPRARDALHALLEAQHYRLAFWRVASDEINYRRFFDVNELAALRMELPEVFEATQGLALDLVARGWVDGLRIDHPDGMRDPAEYFERLQDGYARRIGRPRAGADAQGRPDRPLYVVAEKIAAGHEDVPESWAIHGTTGYRFANVANGVLIDTTAEAAFGRIWRSFTGIDTPYEDVVLQCKRAVTSNALASDMTALASMLLRIARADRHTRDHTLNNLRRALAEVVACMSVYRTYVTDEPSAQDRRFIDEAVDAARARTELADASVFDFIRSAMLGQAGSTEAARALVRRFAARFQQFSAPVAAKGVEDTAFYRHFPLVALNEVGGEPAVFGFTLEAFHAASGDRAERWPHTLLATSTHDNKRAEDVRTRIDVLSEMPATWRLALRRWRALQVPLRRELRATHGTEPSAADEYLLYQTLLGTWEGDAGGRPPADYPDRLVAYLRKAAREAKVHTSWLQPHEAYEAAQEGFVRALLDPARSPRFLEDFRPLAERLAWYGGLNSLVLMALKFTSAGVPDLYQGSEWIDLSLVDPDNRRPVDYALRAQALDALDTLAASAGGALVEQLGELLSPGRLPHAKLWAVSRLLRLRTEFWSVLRDAPHEALEVVGPAAAATIAYRRATPQGQVCVVAGRFFSKQDEASARDAAQAPAAWRSDAWHSTQVVALPAEPGASGWTDVLTGRSWAQGRAWEVDALLRHWPCAVLVTRPVGGG